MTSLKIFCAALFFFCATLVPVEAAELFTTHTYKITLVTDNAETNGLSFTTSMVLPSGIRPDNKIMHDKIFFSLTFFRSYLIVTNANNSIDYIPESSIKRIRIEYLQPGPRPLAPLPEPLGSSDLDFLRGQSLVDAQWHVPSGPYTRLDRLGD